MSRSGLQVYKNRGPGYTAASGSLRTSAQRMGRAGGTKGLSFDGAARHMMSHIVSFPTVEETTSVAKVGEIVVSTVASDAD